MLKKEFEKRIGRKVTPSEYEDVKRDYMGIPSELRISVEQFYEAWKISEAQGMSVLNYLLLQERISANDWELKYRNRKVFCGHCFKRQLQEIEDFRRRIDYLEKTLEVERNKQKAYA